MRTTTIKALGDILRSQLGQHEVPPGSNLTKYGKWYGLDGNAWCAMFQSWGADQAGVLWTPDNPDGIIPKHAYTPEGAAWYQRRDQWGKRARVGAQVFYQWPGMSRISHIGWVEAVFADGSWTAIEGNTDGGGSRTGGIVMRQRRFSVGSLGGFGYPAYSNAPTAPSAPSQAPSSPAGAPAWPGRVLKYTPGQPSMSGNDVLTAQKRLKAHADNSGYPYDYSSGPGVFGPRTDAVVRWYQECRSGAPFNLDVDGQIGPQTWASLWV